MDDEMLGRLVALNLERAAASPVLTTVAAGFQEEE